MLPAQRESRSRAFLPLVPTFLAGALDLHNLMAGAVIIIVIQIGSAAASFAANAPPNRVAIIFAMPTLGAGMWSVLLEARARVPLSRPFAPVR